MSCWLQIVPRQKVAFGQTPRYAVAVGVSLAFADANIFRHWQVVPPNRPRFPTLSLPGGSCCGAKRRGPTRSCWVCTDLYMALIWGHWHHNLWTSLEDGTALSHAAAVLRLRSLGSRESEQCWWKMMKSCFRYCKQTEILYCLQFVPSWDFPGPCPQHGSLLTCCYRAVMPPAAKVETARPVNRFVGELSGVIFFGWHGAVAKMEAFLVVVRLSGRCELHRKAQSDKYDKSMLQYPRLQTGLVRWEAPEWQSDYNFALDAVTRPRALSIHFPLL